MQSSGPQQVKKAVAAVEEELTFLLRTAYNLSQDSAPWQQRDFLKQAREYAARVNRLTRARVRSARNQS